MRTFVMAVVAALTLGFLTAAPASAKTCNGSVSACSKHASGHKYAKSQKKAHRHHASRRHSASRRHHAARTQRAVHRKHASKPRSTTRRQASRKSAPRRAKSYSYSGGSSSGLASYYWQPQRVASGGWFNPNALTAAHKTLPFGTKVRVTNNRNGKSVVVTINDRGPYVKGRVIDLSSRAAGVIGMKGAGVVPISLSVLGR